MIADGMAWRLDDVAAYDVMLDRSQIVTALLLTSQAHGSARAPLSEIVELRTSLGDLNARDRLRVDALSEAFRLRIQELRS